MSNVTDAELGELLRQKLMDELLRLEGPQPRIVDLRSPVDAEVEEALQLAAIQLHELGRASILQDSAPDAPGTGGRNFDLHLFQTREGYWRVRIDGLPGGREYTLPNTTVRGALLVAAQRINVELPPDQRA